MVSLADMRHYQLQNAPELAWTGLLLANAVAHPQTNSILYPAVDPGWHVIAWIASVGNSEIVVGPSLVWSMLGLNNSAMLTVPRLTDVQEQSLLAHVVVTCNFVDMVRNRCALAARLRLIVGVVVEARADHEEAGFAAFAVELDTAVREQVDVASIVLILRVETVVA